MHKVILPLILSVTLVFTVLAIQSIPAIASGEPEVKRVIFIDKFKPVHAGPGSSTDPVDCNTTSDNFQTIGGGITWQHFPVTYNINAKNVNGVNAADAKKAVKDAFDTWDAEQHGGDSDGKFFRDTKKRGQADIKVGWSFIDGPGGTLAFAVTSYFPQSKEIVSVDIVFDSGDSWNTFTNLLCGPQGNGSEFDIEDVAAHEIGHGLGFAHVNALADNKNTEYTFIIFAGETHKRSLAEGERLGMKDLYGGFSDDNGNGGSGACPPAKELKGKCKTKGS